MDDYPLPRGSAQGQIGQGRNPRLASSEDFPALPGSGMGSDVLNDRKGSFLLGGPNLQNGSHLDMLSQQQHDAQRRAFLNTLGSSELSQNGGRQAGNGSSSSRSQVLNAQNR